MVPMNRSIVCAVDGSPVSRWAARVAAAIARDLDLELVLAHVAEDAPTFPYRDARLRELQRREAIELASEMLEHIAAALPVRQPELQVMLGDPVESLRAVSRDEATELVVLGSRGRGPVASAVLGSVSSGVASGASCPVLVVPSVDAARRMLSQTARSVLCGVDGSAGSIAALAFAADLAEWMQLELVPLHVDDDATWEQPPSETAAPFLRVVAGDPVEVLLEQALDEEARLVVVGASSRGRWRAAALGSVPRELAARSPLPVVIVPATPRSLEGVAEVVAAGYDDAGGP